MKRPLPNFIMNFRITWAGLKVLWKNLSLNQLIKLLSFLDQEKKKGSPWDVLPPAESQKDRDSRALIGDAIIIYRFLKENFPADHALTITNSLIQFAAIAQLDSLIPCISRQKIEALSHAEQEKILTHIINQFPNTDWEILASSDRAFTYRIVRCRLVELVDQLGLPELREAFCPGDAIYFQDYQPDLIFERPSTIAHTQNYCDFIFRLKDQTIKKE